MRVEHLENPRRYGHHASECCLYRLQGYMRLDRLMISRKFGTDVLFLHPQSLKDTQKFLSASSNASP